MSFTESAKTFAREKAIELEAKSRECGMLRSLDATLASDWLWEIAAAIREACGDAPTERHKRRKGDRA